MEDIGMNWDSIGVIAEIVSAFAVVVSLAYLARQVAMSNRLARAEAYRSPNSDLNTMNATYSTIPEFNKAIRKALNGATRSELEEHERSLFDAYLISITNLYEQLAREIREGVLGPDAYENFGAKGLIQLPYYRTSWPLYRHYLSPNFVEEFEKRFELDPTIEVSW